MLFSVFLIGLFTIFVFTSLVITGSATNQNQVEKEKPVPKTMLKIEHYRGNLIINCFSDRTEDNSEKMMELYRLAILAYSAIAQQPNTEESEANVNAMNAEYFGDLN